MPRLMPEFITTREEFELLKIEWNELLQRSTSNNVFLTWEWITTWLDYMGEGFQPWVLTIRQPGSGKLLGVAPLVESLQVTRRGLKYRIIEFMGSRIVASDHLDLIIDVEHEHSVAPALIKALISSWGLFILRFNGLAHTSKLAQAIRARPRRYNVSEEICPYIPLPSSWETYQSSLSKRMRENIDYSIRKLERAYPNRISFERVESDMDLDQAIFNLFRLHKSVRETHGEEGAFVRDDMRQFHLQISRLFLKNGWLRFYRFRVSNEDVAMLYCFQYDKRLSYYQSGYNPEWKVYSPGSLIIAHAIMKAINEGSLEFDFLRGAEPYKFRWTNYSRQDLNLEFYSDIVQTFRMISNGAQWLIGPSSRR